MTTPKLARQDKELGRVYWSDVAQQELPSITNIIGMKSKPFLKKWAARVVAEYACDNTEFLLGLVEQDYDKAVKWLKGEPLNQTDAAADRGNQIHDYLEAIGKGLDPPELSGDGLAHKKAADKFLAEWEPDFTHSEVTVFSEAHGYAGTLDFLAHLNDGRYVLGDYKTGKRVYRETAMQLAAARFADRMELGDGYHHEVPTVDDCVVVRLRTRGWYEMRPVEADEEAFNAFRALLYVWRWDKKPGVVGPKNHNKKHARKDSKK